MKNCPPQFQIEPRTRWPVGPSIFELQSESKLNPLIFIDFPADSKSPLRACLNVNQLSGSGLLQSHQRTGLFPVQPARGKPSFEPLTEVFHRIAGKNHFYSPL